MFSPYQQAWLGAHPERSEAWLREALANGFDVHHVDGNHENDAPENLVLIELADHRRLHGGELKCLHRVSRDWRHGAPERKARREQTPIPPLDHLAFKELLGEAGITKTELARRLGRSANAATKWSGNEPKYARAYLELMIAHNALTARPS
jgi:hypothetical protein